jgi:hypothetical protein
MGRGQEALGAGKQLIFGVVIRVMNHVKWDLLGSESVLPIHIHTIPSMFAACAADTKWDSQRNMEPYCKSIASQKR